MIAFTRLDTDRAMLALKLGACALAIGWMAYAVVTPPAPAPCLGTISFEPVLPDAGGRP